MNVSPKLIQLLNEQISHEKYNAGLYQKIGSFLKNMGLEKIGSHFSSTQFDEEISHAKHIVDYLTDRNEKVESFEVNACIEEFNSIIGIAESYLAQEQLTTERLKTIAKLALQEMDFITFGFAQKMLEYQRVEEEEAMTFLDKAKLTENDWKVVLMWEQNF